MEPSDSDLVQRGLRGDPTALHAIVDHHAEPLFAIACSLLGRAADAEDAVQETFLACFAGLKKFENRSALRTWLVAILLRQIAGRRRRQQRRATLPWSEATAAQVSERARVMSETGRADARLDLAAAMSGMSPEQRQVLTLREYGGLSYEEIAQTLGLPRGTVESRLHRARQDLAQRLKDYTEP